MPTPNNGMPMLADSIDTEETDDYGIADAGVTKVFIVIGKVNHFVSKAEATNCEATRAHSVTLYYATSCN